MVTYEELVEKVARRICQSLGYHPDECVYDSGQSIPYKFECSLRRWEMYKPQTTAAIATILEAMSEPTPAMYTAVSFGRMNEYLSALAASPLVEEERKTVSNENSGENDRCPY